MHWLCPLHPTGAQTERYVALCDLSCAKLSRIHEPLTSTCRQDFTFIWYPLAILSSNSVKQNGGPGRGNKIKFLQKKTFKLLLRHFLECAVNYIVKLYLVHFRDFISVMFMLRQFSVKLSHKRKPTSSFEYFLHIYM